MDMMNRCEQTILYYEQNAENYVQNTIGVDFTEIAEKFCSYIQKGGNILDVGCGSGRDAKFFLERGYDVQAFDGSSEISSRATEYLGINVDTKKVQDYVFDMKFDGIWCCASLLHLTISEIEQFLMKAEQGLKQHGYIYISFKYGSYQGMRDGRYYTDQTEESLSKIIENVDGLEIIEMFISGDVLIDREQLWINALLKKIKKSKYHNE